MIRHWAFESQKRVQSGYFSLNGYGIQEPMGAGVVDRPQGTGDYLLMLFLDPVRVGVRARDVSVPGGTLMVWQPGSSQRYGNPEAMYVHSWLHCDGALVRHMLLTCGIPVDTPIPGVAQGRFERHLHAMHDEVQGDAPPDARIVENHLRNLAYDVQRVTRGDAEQHTVAAPLLETRQYIESHYWEPITLPELARMANLSPQHFCTQFRKAFGHPPIGYLLRYRLAQAAYLLIDRNARISEVAHGVGIDDVHYFSRAFKRLYGKSPREMRLSHEG